MTDPILLPAPRQITRLDAVVALPEHGCVVIDSPDLWFEAKVLQTALADAGRAYDIDTWVDSAQFNVRLRLSPDLSRDQQYTLVVGPEGIEIAAHTNAGVWYGVCTLKQLLAQFHGELPALRIEDWPDFTVRGVMLDVSRDKVPTMTTLLQLVDMLASWKINQLQLYIEHTFAYRQHPEVWQQASPFTGQEILELDAYCRERHIELVPNQNSLGHMERWLKHPRYAPLAESPDGFQAPWGESYPPTSLNPVDPESLKLVLSLYDELLPHFTSLLFNIGGDEPWELGQGRSKTVCERIGLGRLYLDYLMKLYHAATERGKTALFWDDIIVHYPELIPELPRDMIAMIWGYEADHPFEERCQSFLQSGIPFYVCPGTSSWNTFGGRLDNMIENQRNAARNGLRYGAVGYLNTDWGDRGHWQTLPISYPGFAYGAALSWGYETNENIDLAAVLNRWVFDDPSNLSGDLMLRLGRLYSYPGHARHNGHALVDLMRSGQDELERWKAQFVERGGDAEGLTQMLSELDELRQMLSAAVMQAPDAALLKRELALALGLLAHACRRGLLVFERERISADVLFGELNALIERYREVWSERNRPGGLDDSVQRFQPALASYTTLLRQNTEN